ncbi:hypothetical protein AB0M43_37255 [Longispora sp. NPDC051575]|uniref:hypothetical protein n=1 Tax=Longispora sp. NPDC051575 TaxID=3154943 RepID=UPI0034193C4C
MRTRPVLATFLSAAVFAAANLVGAAPATAGTLDLTCLGSSSATYSTALTATSQTVATSRVFDYQPCVSTNAPAVISGGLSFGYTAPGFSCMNLLGSGPVTKTITWNTGQTSTITGQRVSSIVGATSITVITGEITAGLFTGDTVVETETGAAAPILTCNLGLGTVSALTYTLLLEITS